MARAPTKKSDETRARILRCATALFNEQGVSAVNTHHVAKAADLSPGNLYYHFSDKEEIIRAIFDQIALFSSKGWRQATAGDDEADSFRNFVDFYFTQVREYRFLFREQAALMRDDPVLADRWRTADRALRAVMRDAVSRWVARGIMIRFESPSDVDVFINNSWIILNFAAAYFESRGERSPASLEKSISRQLAAFLRPYHTPKGQAILDQHFKRSRKVSQDSPR